MEYTDKILKVAQTIVAGMECLKRPANSVDIERAKENKPLPVAAPAPVPIPPFNPVPLQKENENSLRSTLNKESTYTPPTYKPPTPLTPALQPGATRMATAISRRTAEQTPPQQTVKTNKGQRSTKGGRRTNKKRRTTYRR